MILTFHVRPLEDRNYVISIVLFKEATFANVNLVLHSVEK